MPEFTLRGTVVNQHHADAESDYGLLIEVEEQDDPLFIRMDEVDAENLRDYLALALLQDRGDDPDR